MYDCVGNELSRTVSTRWQTSATYASTSRRKSILRSRSTAQRFSTIRKRKVRGRRVNDADRYRVFRNRNGERGEMEFCDRKCLNLSTMRMTYEARVRESFPLSMETWILFELESIERHYDHVGISRRISFVPMVRC